MQGVVNRFALPQEFGVPSNFQMWSALGGKGTPAFVIGNRVILAAVPYETLKEAIAHAREQK